MAPSFLRNNAPAWPPFKDSYRKLANHDEIPLRSRGDILSGSTLSSALPTPYVPTPNLYQTGSPKPSRSERWGLQGWKGGARFAFYTAAVVLLINIVVMITLSTTVKWMDGMTMLYIGSCQTTQRINAGVHLGVNILSTCLLAASNYCMQLLSSPTRNDIDRAHARGHWLDIGVPSLRNLRSLKKKKITLWWILAITSLPLHFLYNSVFFSAIATNDYHIVYATPDFVNGAAFNTTKFTDVEGLSYSELQSRSSQFQRLERKDCIRAYGQDFITDRKDVIVVVANLSSNTNSSVLRLVTEQSPKQGLTPDFNPFKWICDDALTIEKTDACCNNTQGFIPCANMIGELEGIADTWWRSGGYDVDHCLSEQTDPDCHEHFAPAIMAPVLFFSIFKALVIWYVAFRFQDKPLVTVGDAIDSFIRDPDPTTKYMCLATHNQVQKLWSAGYTPQPQRFESKPKRWWRSVSARQWTLFGSLFLFATAGTGLAIGFGIATLNPPTIQNAWTIGMGTVRQQNVISGLKIPSLGANAIFISALIANTPQALVSFLYMIYSTVFSTMFLGQEWDRFATHPKGRSLRVSEPTGGQKSTYFLQIPYRYAGVMLATSGLLHWLVSQSIFLANISIIPLSGTIPLKDEIISCAFSVKGMIFVLLVGLVMLVWILSNGLRKYSGLMVMVGSNSAAISASCHVLGRDAQDRERMVQKPLKWGATDFGNQAKRSATASSFGSVFSPYQDKAFGTTVSERGLPSGHATPRQIARLSWRDDKHDSYDDKKASIVRVSEFKSEDDVARSASMSPYQQDTEYKGAAGNNNNKTNRSSVASRFREIDVTVTNENETQNFYDSVDNGFGFEAAGGEQVGHCTFSDGLVGRPVEGRLYA